ncbi:thioredoxin family protein [Nocardioides sp. HDW12B]|uniref:thioredoxin family protein n=1 Tax=Nocardioides sp. HDW12B TaxID=2714939 RepID=UPI00140AACA1|nr:thioredoxin family protein [Nocardioides sp. HDW12B]QIK68250.1 thioredoxin family protein [Nocardioides sp. HDW12B]
MGVGDWVVVVVLVAATIFGAHRALTDGRFRGTHRVRDAAGAEPAPPTTTPSTTAAPPTTAAPSTGAAMPTPAAPEGPTPAHDVPDRLTAADLGAELGERATLLQFSSAFCAPCRATRRVLADVAAVVPGVTHVEVDAESHLALVRRVGVQRTPTTLILAADGGEVSRASGALRKPQVLHALSSAVQP